MGLFTGKTMQDSRLRPLLKLLPLIVIFSAGLLLISTTLDNPSPKSFTTSSIGILDNGPRLFESAYLSPWDTGLEIEYLYSEFYHRTYWFRASVKPVIKAPDKSQEKEKDLPQTESLELPIGWGALLYPSTSIIPTYYSCLP